jgi:hypothetical protein
VLRSFHKLRLGFALEGVDSLRSLLAGAVRLGKYGWKTNRLAGQLWAAFDPDGDGIVPTLELLGGLVVCNKCSVEEKVLLVDCTINRLYY